MKKNNLKRFLASLLAVLMLASVTGVSPAVFADWGSNVSLTAAKATDKRLELNGDKEIRIPYKDNGDIDFDALYPLIFETCVDKSKSALQSYDKSKIDIEQQQKACHKLEGDFTCEPIKEDQTYTIKFTYHYGSLLWDKTEKSCKITFLGREASVISFKDNPTVKIQYNDDLSIKLPELKAAIWENVVDSTTPADLSTANVSIKYYANAVTGSTEHFGHAWVKLDGDKVSGLTYPAISEGTWKLRFEFAGNADYKGFSEDVEVVKFTGRDPAFELKDNVEGMEIGLVFKSATEYDYDATAAAIREALVTKLGTIDLSDVKVQYKSAGQAVDLNYKPSTPVGTAFGEGEFTIVLTWGGDKGTAQYKPFSEEVKLTLVDNRRASSVSVIDKAGITYNMNASEMEKAIFNSVINWDASELPAKDTLTADSFVIEYYATAQFEAGDTTTKLPDDIAHAWVPIGGLSKTVDLSFIGLGKIGIVYPQMGAGEQQIRIRFIGSADYKPSAAVEGTLNVAKADVKVNVKRPVIIMHAGDKDLPEGSITLTPDDKSIDVYTVFAGITSKIGGKVTTSVYLDLPDRYTTDNKLLTKVLDPLFESVIGRTFTDVLQEGITVGELKQLAAKASEVADKIGKIGIDVESFTKLMDTIANLPGIVDDMRIAIGTPNHAGIYQAFVITNNVNYNTAYGTGTVLVLKQFNGISLVKNSAFDANGGKITVSQAAEIADSVCILSNDDGPLDNEAQGAVRYLFTGIKDSRGLYSNKTMPTEPGRYIVTATVVGGDFFAFPKTFSFKIVADPTPETTPEA